VLQRGHECETDCLSRLVAGLRSGSSVRERLEQDVGVGLQPGRFDSAGRLGRVRDRWHLTWAASAVAKHVETAVGRDPVEPGAQRGASLEPAQSAPGCEQRFLHGVLGILERTEDAVAVQLQLCAVRVDELAKRGLVARAGAAEGGLGHDTTSLRIAKLPVRIRRRRCRNEHDDESGLMRGRMTQPITASAAVRAAVPVTAAALTSLAVAAGAWVVAFRQMNGMDMGVETELGMMLPGAAVAVFRSASVRGVPLFVGAYLLTPRM
jgi:hypothetical protein